MFTDITLPSSSAVAFTVLIAGVLFASLREILVSVLKKKIEPFVTKWLYEILVAVFTIFTAIYLWQDGNVFLAVIEMFCGSVIIAMKHLRKSQPSSKLSLLFAFLLILPVGISAATKPGVKNDVIGNFIVSHSFERRSGLEPQENLEILSNGFRETMRSIFANVLDVYPESSAGSYQENLYPNYIPELTEKPRIRLDNVHVDNGASISLIVKPAFLEQSQGDYGNWIKAEGAESDTRVMYLKSALGVVHRALEYGQTVLDPSKEQIFLQQVVSQYLEFRLEGQALESEVNEIRALRDDSEISFATVDRILHEYLESNLDSRAAEESSSSNAQIEAIRSLQ